MCVIIGLVIIAVILYYLLQHVEYNLSFESSVKADFEPVCNFWKDMQSLKKVHPYVESIDLIEQHTEGKYTVSSYNVREKLPGLPLHVPYDSVVRKTFTEGDKFSFNLLGSALKGALKIDSTVVIYETDNKMTKLEQASKVKVLRLLSFAIIRQYKDAQQRVLDGVKAYLEKSQ